MSNVVAVLILAGGDSRRMGSPKALLTLSNQNHHKQTLLSYHIDNAKLLNLPILIGDNGKGFLATKESQIIPIEDYIKNSGALSCLLNAFVYCKEDMGNQVNDKFLMVISCDNLLNMCDVFELTANDLDGCHGSYLVDEISNKDYPLLGCYSLALYDDLKVYLDKGGRSVMKFLQDKNIRKVPMPQYWQDLANINTPDEFFRALVQFEIQS